MRILIAVCTLLFSNLTFSQTLVVGLSSVDYPPYYYSGENGLEGAAVTIAETLAGQLGYQLVYKRYPWKRVQKYLETGDIDMVLVYFKTPARARYVVYTDKPHLTETASLFTAKHLKLTFAVKLDQLSGYQFFGVRGYFYGEAYANAKYLKQGEVKDEPELVKRIANPHFDLVGVGNKPAIKYYARKLGLSGQFNFMSPAIFEGLNYFAFSKARLDAQLLAQNFSQALVGYMASDQYKQVLKRHGLTAPGEPK